MKRHWNYLKYVFRHKWFVLIAGVKIGAPFWRLIIHDWSKFLPSEWKPYAYTFYDKNGNKQYKESPEFKRAWNYHQKRNKHHWQYWLLKEDDGLFIPIAMPEKYMLEMLADWMGAGRAITGRWEVVEWYEKNNHKIILHDYVRICLEQKMKEIKL